MSGIVFHYFHNNNQYLPCQGSIDAVNFEKILCYLFKHFSVLSIDEYISKCVKGSLTEKDICLTFDDGIKSQYEVAVPILNKYGIKAGFFIYTEPWSGVLSDLEVHHDFRFFCYKNVKDFYNDFFKSLSDNKEIFTSEVEEKIKNFQYEDYKPYCIWHTYEDKLFRFTRSKLLDGDDYRLIMTQMMQKKGYNSKSRKEFLWMKEKEIIALEKQGHLIGLHSHTHPTSFDNMSFKRKFDEFKTNYDVLEGVLTRKPIAVAYPCGNFDKEIEDIMFTIGISVGFKASPEKGKGMLDLARLNHTEIVKKMEPMERED